MTSNFAPHSQTRNQHKHMAPQLQDFPDELLVQVLNYLPKSDLKSARLTCTRYGRIGAQWLFQRVYFAPRKAAIDTFLNISANPTFARTVTELVYDARLFLPELTAYKAFKAAFDKHIPDEDDGYGAGGDQAGDGTESTDNDDDTESLPRSVKPDRNWIGSESYHEALANDLVRYTRLVDQQQKILGNRKEYKALLTGLDKFPNITTVVILDEVTQWGELSLRDEDHSWYTERSRHEATVLAPSPWTQQMHPIGATTKKADVRGIHNLILAASVHCQKLKELQLASIRSYAPTNIFEMDEATYDKACSMVPRLTSLKMNLTVSGIGDEDWQEQHSCLKGFLSEARELRCCQINGRISIHVFNDTIWPHLETLHWGDLGLSAAEFKNFTQAHKGTLRELKLRNIYIYGEEGWADAAKEIGKHLRLRRVCIFGVCDEVTREAGETPYLDDATHWAVARSFMQSVPRTICLDPDSDDCYAMIVACPGEGEAGVSHSS